MFRAECHQAVVLKSVSELIFKRWVAIKRVCDWEVITEGFEGDLSSPP